MKGKLIDDTFISLGKLLISLKYESIDKIDSPKIGNKVVDEYLDYSLDLIKQGIEPKILDVELSMKISVYILNRSIDEKTLRVLELIRGLIHTVRSADYETILSYARFSASYEIFRELNDNILQELVAKGF